MCFWNESSIVSKTSESMRITRQQEKRRGISKQIEHGAALTGGSIFRVLQGVKNWREDAVPLLLDEGGCEEIRLE